LQSKTPSTADFLQALSPSFNFHLSTLKSSVKNLSSPKSGSSAFAHLYGPGPLQQVASNAQQVAGALAASKNSIAQTVFQGAPQTPRRNHAVMLAATRRQLRAHLWMHTVLAVENVDSRLSVLKKPRWRRTLHRMFIARSWRGDGMTMDFYEAQPGRHVRVEGDLLGADRGRRGAANRRRTRFRERRDFSTEDLSVGEVEVETRRKALGENQP